MDKLPYQKRLQETRRKFRKYFQKKDIEQLIELFDVYAEVIRVSTKVDICRDLKDNFLLSLTKDSNAEAKGDQLKRSCK